MKLRRGLLAAALMGLAPVLITVTNRAGDSLWLIPAGLLPILLLGEHWPSQWSLLTFGAFGMVVLGLSLAVRRSGPGDKWRGLRSLALLSLAGPTLLVASLATVGSDFWPVSPSWCGSAVVAWELLLLYLTRGLESTLMAWLLRLWLLMQVMLGGWVFVFGALAGLCC